jgi:hypothetical protein
LSAFDVQTAEYAGLAGISNGALIAAAEGRFDVIVTTDKRLRFQQNLTGRLIAIVVLDAASNRLPDLLRQADALVAAIRSVKLGEVHEVAAG